jgi:predicted Holliday junction resolvase-like endonuclease
MVQLMRILLLASFLLLTGCIARTAYDIVTLPVKVISAGVDAATTSQSEADERRGRELREEEERAGRDARSRERETRREREARRERERAAEQDEDEPER